MRPFEVFGHTADIGLKARGSTLRGLFQNAALGMTSLLVEPRKLEIRRRDAFELKAGNWEDLLVAWLNEILFAFSTEKKVFKNFKVTAIRPFELKAEAFGQKMRSRSIEVLREIKAVTYHDLKIKKSAAGYSVKIIFDI